MTREMRQVGRIQNAMTCNRFIFWLQKVPLVRRLFPDRIYGDRALKQGVGTLVAVLNWLCAFGGKFLYLFVVCVLPQFLSYGADLLSRGWPSFVGTFFFLSIWAGCFLQSDVLAPTLIKYTCVRQMGVPAKACVAATTGKQHAVMLLTFTPALVAVALAYGQPVWMGLALSIELASVRLVAEWLFLWLYDKTGMALGQKTLYLFAVMLLSLTGAYAPMLAQRPLPLDLVLLHPACMGALLLLGGVSGWRLWRYPRYRALLMERCRADTVLATAAKAKVREAAFRDVKLRDSDLERSTNTAALARYHGYDYLNALFFLRHRRMLTRPLWIELGIVAILFLAGLAGVLVFPSAAAELLAQVPESLRYFVFVMYLACNTMGTRICKAMFYNCDISLLRYPWYRERNVVLKNFSVRLRRIAAINLALGGALCLALLALLGAAGVALPAVELIPFFLGILCLAVFFSVHPLFLYYIFQPYTTQLAVNNPFFKGLNFVVYLVCYACIYMRQSPNGFVVIVLAATILYCAAALLAVWKHASNTFRVK